ncbi:MAG: hypothetical protein BWY77_01808 [bacterium ADurb.Bin431]|nr:MAG: hypothetical protein BWY77_01808 [bacterium ADurb.Bin431]
MLVPAVPDIVRDCGEVEEFGKAFDEFIMFGPDELPGFAAEIKSLLAGLAGDLVPGFLQFDQFAGLQGIVEGAI